MKIGRYDIRDTLSSGHFADVYLGYDEMLEREVVIKLLPESADSAVLSEAQRMVALGDVPVVQIYDTGVADERLFYVMPKMQGGTLAERIREDGLSVLEVEPILAALTKALTAAHANGIVHCDIKPSNVLFSAENEAHIADFGISHHLSDTTSDATTTSGTPAYMAPEQWQNEPPTPQIDIYQCGVLLFLLLSGHLPYQAEDNEGYKIAHCEAQIPQISRYVSHLSNHYDDFFRRALAKEKADRFVSMQDLEAEFLKPPALIAPPDLPIDVPESPPTFHPSQLVRGHEWVMFWTVGTLVGWLIGVWLLNLLSARVGLPVVPRLANRLFAVGMMSAMGGVVGGLIVTLTVKTIEGRMLTQLPRRLTWQTGLLLALFVELGVIVGAVFALNGGFWRMTFLLVGCLPAVVTGGIVGELYARREPRFQQPQRIALILGWLFAGVVAWFVMTLLH